MICKKCGNETPDGFVFCRTCGAKLDYSQNNKTNYVPNKKPFGFFLVIILIIAVIFVATAMIVKSVKKSQEVRQASEKIEQSIKESEENSSIKVVDLSVKNATTSNIASYSNVQVEEVISEIAEIKEEEELNPTASKAMPMDKVKRGSVISFGSYIQDGDKGTKKTALKWRVLKVKDNEALLVCEMGIDCKKYNEYNTETYWERCTLRKWLNETFYDTAFTAEDKSYIIKHRVGTAKNKTTGTRSGNPTYDYVAIPSEGELDSYLTTAKSRMAQGTAYSVFRGALLSQDANTFANGFYWLRNGGMNRMTAMVVDPTGNLAPMGMPVISNNVLVRPSIWVSVE